MNNKIAVLFIVGAGVLWGCKQRPQLLDEEGAPGGESGQREENGQHGPGSNILADGALDDGLSTVSHEDLDRLEQEETDAIMQEVEGYGDVISLEDAEAVLASHQEEENEALMLSSDERPEFSDALAASGLEGKEELTMDEFRSLLKEYRKLWAQYIFQKYDADQNENWSEEELKNWLTNRLSEREKGDLPVEERVEKISAKIMDKFGEAGESLSREDVARVRGFFRILKKKQKRSPGFVKHTIMEKIKKRLAESHARKFFSALTAESPVSPAVVDKVLGVWGGDDDALSRAEVVAFLQKKHKDGPWKKRFPKAGSGPEEMLADEEISAESEEDNPFAAEAEDLVDQVWAELSLADTDSVLREVVPELMQKLKDASHERKIARSFEKASEGGLTREKLAELFEHKKRDHEHGRSPGEIIDEVIVAQQLPDVEAWNLDQWRLFWEGIKSDKISQLMKKIDQEEPKGQLNSSEVKKFLLDYWSKKKKHPKRIAKPSHSPDKKGRKPFRKHDDERGDPGVFAKILDENLDAVMAKFSSDAEGALSESDFANLMKRVKSIRHGHRPGKPGEFASVGK